jgi:hypothetical protein
VRRIGVKETLELKIRRVVEIIQVYEVAAVGVDQEHSERQLVAE